jgi:Chaperone of endosialidase
MKKIFLLLSLIVIFIGANAQIEPTPDNPCSAVSWPVFAADVLSPECLPIQTSAYYFQYTNATLTGGIPNPSCVLTNPQNIRDIWFKCTVPTSGRLSIRITEGFPDLVMTAYTAVGGCGGTLTEVGCNNDYTDINPRVQLSGLTAFAQVYIRIFNNPSTVVNSGGFRMCISDYYDNLPVVDNSTKVGIGAVTPFAKLDVVGTGIFRDKTFFAKDIDVRGNADARGSLRVYGLLRADSILLAGGGVTGNFLTTDLNGFGIWQPLPAGATAWGSTGADIYNNNGGNVGIGLTSPTFKFHLGNANNGLRIEGPLTAASGGSALNIGGFGDVIIDKPGVVGGRLAIKENGDVGIGSATPSAYGHGGTNRVLEIRNFAAAGINIQSHLILSSTGNAGSLGGVTWASTSLSGEQRTGFIGNAFEATNRTRLSFYARNDAGLLTEKFYISGDGSAWLQGTLTQNSDSRLKKKITPINNALQSLTQLSGYNYYWKNTGMDNNLQTGVLAQEVQKIFPNLVKTGENGTLSVNYTGLIPVMIESIKEQQKQIEELKLLVQKLLNK